MQICILLPKEHSFIGAESTGEEGKGQDYFFFLGPVLIPQNQCFGETANWSLDRLSKHRLFPSPP